MAARKAEPYLRGVVIEAAGILLGSDEVTLCTQSQPSNCISCIMQLLEVRLKEELFGAGLSDEERFHFFTLLTSLPSEPPVDFPDELKLHQLLYEALDILDRQPDRLKLKRRPVLLVFEDTLQAHLALESAAHISSRNTLDILLIGKPFDENRRYLLEDLSLRLEKQFQLKSSDFNIEIVCATDCIQHIVRQQSLGEYLVIGRSNNSANTDRLQFLIDWAAWKSSMGVIVVPQTTRSLPLGLQNTNRRFMVAVKSVNQVAGYFTHILQLMQPTDTAVFVTFTELAVPNIISKEYAYFQDELKDSTFRDKDSSAREQLHETILNMIGKSDINGEIHCEDRSSTATVGQQLFRCALKCNADFILIQRGASNRIIMECMTLSSAALIIV